MKPLTKKQRREIYLKVAQKIDSDIEAYGHFMCNLISSCSGIDKDDVLEIFPEFALFQNGTRLFGSIWFYSSQFSNDTEANQVRVLILLMSAEMCKP